MITLHGCDSAVFLARMEYGNQFKKEKYTPMVLKSGTGEIKLNPEYKSVDKETRRINRWKNENKKREFIINYLKEKYPDEDYAERFKKNDKWNLPLRFPTEESIECNCHTDENHCNIERKSGCYTCCFICFDPDLCQWSNCKLLVDKI